MQLDIWSRCIKICLYRVVKNRFQSQPHLGWNTVMAQEAVLCYHLTAPLG